jgi:ABC-type multidrug transport system ATPase subunit
MPSAHSAIEARAMAKRYAGGIVALDGIDLAIAPGTVTAIIGANGSGKSTPLKILAGIVHPDAGSVRVLGVDPALRPPELRMRLGYVAQSAELDPEMTGADTLQLFATLHGIVPGQAQSRIGELSRAFGLGDHLPRLVGTYSGGLRQRLHIAISFVHQPELILMDEPTAALDPNGRIDVWHLVQRFRDEGRTAVLVTHDTMEAARHCEAVVLLHRGRVAAVGSPEELVAKHARWTLEITLAKPVVDPASFLECIGLPATPEEALLRGNRLTTHFANTDPDAALQAKNVVIDRIESAGEIVVGFRLDPPDLLSAYFKLTGVDMTRFEIPSSRQRGRSRAEKRGLGKDATGQ